MKGCMRLTVLLKLALASSVWPRSRSTRADFIQMRSLAKVLRAFSRILRARSISLFSNSILKAASQICSLSAPVPARVRSAQRCAHTLCMTFSTSLACKQPSDSYRISLTHSLEDSLGTFSLDPEGVLTLLQHTAVRRCPAGIPVCITLRVQAIQEQMSCSVTWVGDIG